MSEFFRNVGFEISQLVSFFITIALLQNVVLTTGFGASLTMQIVRKPKNIWLFSAILTVFSTTTVAIAYPLDKLYGTAITNIWRPLMIAGITVVLYIAATLLLQRFASRLYNRIQRLLPMAAFNTLVSGVALTADTHFSFSLSGIIGLAIGSCLGFGIITWLIAEGIERLDNPDIPAAFRGMPATLIYIGILALALLGFSSTVSLI